jgi:endonuclease IV
MGAYHSFYRGGDYGFEPGPENSPLGFSYGERISAGSIGVAVDSRTANQLKAVSDKLSSGAKVVEVQAVDPGTTDAIPQQQFKEIARLKKLVGNEVTFHGPLVEATGIGREGWDEGKRESAERQLLQAVRRGHDLDEKGNLVVTFHSTAALPEMETKVITTEDGKKVQKITEIYVIDEKTHGISPIKVQPNYLLDEKGDPQKEIERQNRENWSRLLTHASYNAHQVENSLRSVNQVSKIAKEYFSEDDSTTGTLKLYKSFQTEEGRKKIEKEVNPEQLDVLKSQFNEINFGEVYLRDAYNEMQNLFDRAWLSAERNNHQEDLDKLKNLRKEMLSEINSGRFLDPVNLSKSAELLQKGVQVMTALDNTPQLIRPLKDFAKEKASETYGNVAYKAYKEFGSSAPIISIENPPAGGGISRAEDLRDLVKASRDRFIENARSDGMSEDEAKKLANKHLGVTWDVGHINMIRKFGYSKEDVIEETKKIAPFVKHVHLSDNFGMEHTELPMGMGNVPTKEMLNLITQYNDKVKKIVETGGPWYQFFQKTPLRETFEAFGSPVFQGQGSYWNTAASTTGTYFGGFGMNPDIHHSVYGAGFSSLPVELGGNLPGRGGSRLTGNPME